VPFFPRAFLPAFNEGSLVLGLVMQPGTSLAEANRVGAVAETLIRQVPEVTQVGRRTGRAELDEHAEGVHSAEIDVDLKRSGRDRETIMADIRERLSVLPAQDAIGQPISHRLDHLLSGVRAQIAVKIFGDDTDTLRGLAEQMRGQLATRAGAGRPDGREAGADPADHRAPGPPQGRADGPAPARRSVCCRR
jgi:Cu/Ag efflux pump CusA